MKKQTAHVDQTVKHPRKKIFWGCFSYKNARYRISCVSQKHDKFTKKYRGLLEKRQKAELKKVDTNQAIIQQDWLHITCQVSGS